MRQMVLGFAFRVRLGGIPEVLLILKDRPDWQRGKYNGLGGSVKPPESYAQAMAREFQEETPTARTVWANWEYVLAMEAAGFPAGPQAGDDWRVAVFAYRDDRLPDLPGTGTEPCQWFPINQLPENAVRNVPWLVPMAWDRLAGGLGCRVTNA